MGLIKKTSLSRVVLFSFALSGFTVFIYEVVWTRPLQLVFGSTIYAVSALLTAFMVGFCSGAFFFRNIADGVKSLLLLFAFLELGIGLYGLLILYLFQALPLIYLSLWGVPGFQYLQFVLAFAVLIVPATLFGATWPVANQAYVNLKEAGKDIGRIYSFNALGGVLGSLSAGFLLIPWLGIQKTSLAAASLNLFIGVLIFVYARRNQR